VAASLQIRADGSNGFPVPIDVEGIRITAYLDTGFFDPECATSLTLTESAYRQIAPRLRDQEVTHAEVPGRATPVLLRSGLGTVSIVDFDDSAAEVRIASAGVNLLGVCYFTRLSGVHITWDVDQRIVSVDRRR
jgi:hypothetical protein